MKKLILTILLIPAMLLGQATTSVDSLKVTNNALSQTPGQGKVLKDIDGNGLTGWQALSNTAADFVSLADGYNIGDTAFTADNKFYAWNGIGWQEVTGGGGGGGIDFKVQNTLFVDPTYDQVNGGAAREDPFRPYGNIQTATNAAQDGDTIVIRTGIYSQNINGDINYSDTRSLTFVCNPGVVIQGRISHAGTGTMKVFGNPRLESTPNNLSCNLALQPQDVVYLDSIDNSRNTGPTGITNTGAPSSGTIYVAGDVFGITPNNGGSFIFDVRWHVGGDWFGGTPFPSSYGPSAGGGRGLAIVNIAGKFTPNNPSVANHRTNGGPSRFILRVGEMIDITSPLSENSGASFKCVNTAFEASIYIETPYLVVRSTSTTNPALFETGGYGRVDVNIDHIHTEGPSPFVFLGTKNGTTLGGFTSSFTNLLLTGTNSHSFGGRIGGNITIKGGFRHEAPDTNILNLGGVINFYLYPSASIPHAVPVKWNVVHGGTFVIE